MDRQIAKCEEKQEWTLGLLYRNVSFNKPLQVGSTKIVLVRIEAEDTHSDCLCFLRCEIALCYFPPMPIGSSVRQNPCGIHDLAVFGDTRTTILALESCREKIGPMYSA